jgi:hypothetical protein
MASSARPLDSAQIGLLLVSNLYLASKFITQVELANLLSSPREGGISIRWVPVSGKPAGEFARPGPATLGTNTLLPAKLLRESSRSSIGGEDTIRTLKHANGRGEVRCIGMDPYYILMQHAAEQGTWRHGVRQVGMEKVPLETRLEIVAQIADALEAEHDSRVIHRDVRPRIFSLGPTPTPQRLGTAQRSGRVGCLETRPPFPVFKRPPAEAARLLGCIATREGNFDMYDALFLLHLGARIAPEARDGKGKSGGLSTEVAAILD